MGGTEQSMYLKRSLLVLLLLMVSVCVAACNVTVANPDNPSPSTLDVTIQVLDEAASTDGKNLVTMQLLSSGTIMQLTHGETITCNGTPINSNGLAYVGSVARAAVGGTYQFVYTWNSGSAAITLAVPQRPVVTSPTAGATVTRTTSLTINYIPDSGSGIDASAGDGSSGVDRNINEPDNGTYTGLDVSQLHAGSGVLAITRIFESTLPGTGFKSVKTTYRSSSVGVQVTWA